MNAYESDDAASETLEKFHFRYTPPDSPIPQITRASTSSPETVESHTSRTSKASKGSLPVRKKQRRKKVKGNPGQADAVLFRYFAPNNPEIVKGGGSRTFDLGSSGESETEDQTMDGAVQLPAPGPSLLPPRDTALSNTELVGTVSAIVSAVGNANLALNSTLKRSRDEIKDFGPTYNDVNSNRRNGSASVIDMDRRRTSYQKPLTLSTSHSEPNSRMRDVAAADGLMKLKGDSPRRASVALDTIATSPILQPHLISASQGAIGQTLPAMTAESPPGVEASAVPKQDVNLPPLSHLIGATRMSSERPRAASYSSVSTKAGPSPPLGHRILPQPLQSPFQPGPSLSRTSTISSQDGKSPAESLGEAPQDMSRIIPDRRPYHQRRVPLGTGDVARPFLTSNRKDTSGSSKSVASTSTVNTSLSTNTEPFSPDSRHTPTDTHTSEGTPQSSNAGPQSATYLHYPTVPIGGYRCQHEGCDAPPFSTQYLLNSHANVHSQERPHYCPVEGCSRGKGGRGFKRKNEMIRHGLVHQSPGYICPWCPDREHKYPRPDNLQRHVRMHHEGKDRDDPMLLEVLSQRPSGGATRGRKRRNN